MKRVSTTIAYAFLLAFAARAGAATVLTFEGLHPGPGSFQAIYSYGGLDWSGNIGGGQQVVVGNLTPPWWGANRLGTVNEAGQVGDGWALVTDANHVVVADAPTEQVFDFLGSMITALSSPGVLFEVQVLGFRPGDAVNAPTFSETILADNNGFRSDYLQPDPLEAPVFYALGFTGIERLVMTSADGGFVVDQFTLDGPYAAGGAATLVPLPGAITLFVPAFALALVRLVRRPLRLG